MMNGELETKLKVFAIQNRVVRSCGVRWFCSVKKFEIQGPGITTLVAELGRCQQTNPIVSEGKARLAASG